jgi:hypothetical protein
MGSLVVALVAVVAVLGAVHVQAREGRLIRSPPSPVTSSSSFPSASSAGDFRPNPHYGGGPDLWVGRGSLTLHANATGVTPGGESRVRAYCVVDGRAVFEATPAPSSSSSPSSSWHCPTDGLVTPGGMHTVAAYVHDVDTGRISLLGAPLFFTLEEGPNDDGGAEEAAATTTTLSTAAARLAAAEARLRALTPAGSATAVGVYYTTYQQEDAQIYQNVTRLFNLTNTLEEVLRNESLRYADSVWRWAPEAASPPYNASRPLLFLHQPALGIYCYYRKRANETAGYIPDCPEASTVLQTHAAELTAAGFTFVAPDATNWDGDPRDPSNGADLHQLRPTEVLAEEWAALRVAGTSTPMLSTFDQLNDGGVLWSWYLSEFFNNETLLDLDLILRVNVSTSPTASALFKVYIVADEPTASYPLLRTLQRNGGQNDIITPLMWAADDASGAYEANGMLKFFSPCVATPSAAPSGAGGARSSSSSSVSLSAAAAAAAGAAPPPVFSGDTPIDLDVPCGHLKTQRSVLGGAWTVQTGTPVNSVPFGSSPKYNGLTLKKTFYDILADPTPTGLIFAPSWNEFVVGPVNMSGWDISNPFFYANGARPDDPDRRVIFLDGYGSERSRTIEPSKTDGGYYYETFASCLRVYRLQWALGVVSDGTGCAVAGEECCQLHVDESFARLWSLDLPGAGGGGGGGGVSGDSLLTPDSTEVDRLLWRGERDGGIGGASSSWAQICSPWANSANGQATGFCANGSMPWAPPGQLDPPPYDVLRGPAIVFSNATGAEVPGAVPLVRCVATVGSPPVQQHFLANSTACLSQAAPGGAGALEFVAGFCMASRSSLMHRELRRCRGAANAAPWKAGVKWYAAVGGLCAPGDDEEALLGYVM